MRWPPRPVAGRHPDMMPGFVPSERVQALIASGEILPDEAQLALLPVIDSLRDQILSFREPNGFKSLVAKALARPQPVIKGLYLWGAVGRGKTLLMDLFYQSLGDTRKQRLHFHRLMQRVHANLTALSGTPDPLRTTAERLSAEAKVLCIDEFYVTDIGDAMILAGLLQALVAQGVVLTATSNLAPDALYENGLQRRRFLPAIDLIHAHMQVMAVGAGTDFRMRLLQDAGTYHSPNDAAAEARIQASFAQLADESAEQDVGLEILNRIIRARQVSGGVAIFDFHDLCETARSQMDYIEIARLFHTVIVSDVPVMEARQENAARRFVALVDELYDRCVNLIVSAESPVEGIYRGGQHEHAFQRCRSRLIEMRSVEYMERMHKA